MQTLGISIQNRSAVLISGCYVAAGSANSDRITVTLDSEWDALTTRKAYFNRSGTPDRMVQLVNNSCLIPSDMLQKPGIIYCVIVGMNTTTRLTSSPVGISVGPGTVSATKGGDK